MTEFETVEEFIAAFKWTQEMYIEALRRAKMWTIMEKHPQLNKKQRNKNADNNWQAMNYLESSMFTLFATNRKFKNEVNIDWKKLDTVLITKKVKEASDTVTISGSEDGVFTIHKKESK